METVLISSFTFLLGFIISNWLAIGRDKRKEFNEAAAPIRGWLLKAKDCPHPNTRSPSEQEFDRFVHYLWPLQRRAFHSNLNSYRELHQAQQVTNDFGEVGYKSTIEISRQLNKLFKYTSLK